MSERCEKLRINPIELPCGAYLLDCGIHVPGGLNAGLEFASVCLAGKAQVQWTSGDRATWDGAWVQVTTDHPTQACMLAQYAGWPVQHDAFFAMGSGAMRIKRGKEAILEEFKGKRFQRTGRRYVGE